MRNMEEIFVDSLKGKYFQYKLNPSFILEVPEEVFPEMSLVNFDSTFSAWESLEKRHYSLKLKDFNLYREISKEYFKKVKGMYEKGLEKEIEKDFNKERSQDNEANLSEQKIHLPGHTAP